MHWLQLRFDVDSTVVRIDFDTTVIRLYCRPTAQPSASEAVEEAADDSFVHPFYVPPLIDGGIQRCFFLTSVWRLSIVYLGHNSRTERLRKTKIGTGVAHVTRDSDTTFNVKRSKVKVTRPLYSPRSQRVRQLQRWAWERIGRVKLLPRCCVLGGARRFGAHGGRRGHIVAVARLQLVFRKQHLF